MDEQLREVSNLADFASFDEDGIIISNLPSDDLKEFHTIRVTFSPFKVEQWVNDVLIMIVNPKDTLWVEHGDVEFTPEEMSEKIDAEGNSVWPNLDFER